MEVKIEKLAYGGIGIAYLDGKVCFIEGGLPGETVEIEVTKTRPRLVEAKLLRVLKPSAQRVIPQCPHYGHCGGCQYQHVSYDEELHWKTVQVREYFERHLNVTADKISDIVASNAPYRTRHHFTAQPAAEGRVGFFAGDNKTVIAVESCALVKPELEQVIKNEKVSRRETFRLTAEGKVVSSRDKAFFQVKAEQKKIWTHTRSFFQANLDVAGKIAEMLKQRVEAIGPDWFIDLYGGSGFFSSLSAEKARRIFISEENHYALEALEKNFEDDIRDIVIAAGKTEDVFFDWWSSEKPENSIIFVDPPRHGLDLKAAVKLGRLKRAKHLAYLSCHLGSLVRDLEVILKKGRWQVEEIIPFDMFPRTKHIELLIFLKQTPQERDSGS